MSHDVAPSDVLFGNNGEVKHLTEAGSGAKWKWNSFAQSYLTLCDPVDFTVHGILLATILEWVAFPFSMGSA